VDFFVCSFSTCAVALSNAVLPAVIALVLPVSSVVRFSLRERKNEQQKEGRVPLRTPHSNTA
jgi:hypothetical protein